MIKINYKQNNEVIEYIHINGHADYDEFGKDIVCASVSSIAITSVNAILSIDCEAIKYKESNGNLEIEKINDNEDANKILINLINMLNELAKDYPKNIKIREDE